MPALELFLYSTSSRKSSARSPCGVSASSCARARPTMEHPSWTKNSRSASVPSAHLFASCARRTCSLENISSRSKRSSAGGGGSRTPGGKTAGCSGGSGVSNWGGMRLSCAFLTFSVSYRPTTSGTRSVWSLKRPVSKRLAQSRDTSCPSWRHARRRSARASVSGRCWNSAMSGSSASTAWSLTEEAGLRNLKMKSMSLEFSSLSSHLSSKTRADPMTTSRPAFGLLQTAAMGRCIG
mmetsp:Transcript_1008/g.2400  ORF Transcript_1008/g.2400 Transcript_1008/m.2400 type:complete len:237 (-) Transcript_1008:262-972(-)